MRRLIAFLIIVAALAYGSAAIVRNVAAKCATHAASLQEGAQ